MTGRSTSEGIGARCSVGKRSGTSSADHTPEALLAWIAGPSARLVEIQVADQIADWVTFGSLPLRGWLNQLARQCRQCPRSRWWNQCCTMRQQRCTACHQHGRFAAMQFRWRISPESGRDRGLNRYSNHPRPTIRSLVVARVQDTGSDKQSDNCDCRGGEGGSIVFHTGRTYCQARRSEGSSGIANRSFTVA